MKVCFFTENHYKGGLDTFLINLFNAWPEPSDELTLVCNGSHPGLQNIERKAVRKIKILKYNRVFSSKVSQGQSSLKFARTIFVRAFFELTYRAIQYPILFPWYLCTLTFFFRRSNFERLMVVNGGYPASLLCRCAAIAWRLSGKSNHAIFNFHNSTTKPPWYFSYPEYLIDLAVIWSVERIVSVSMNCLNTLKSRKAFLGCTKLHYIYNGIEDPTLPSKREPTSRGQQSTTDLYCLMLATYEPRKGHAYLLQAFKIVTKEFPDVRLKIYGHGTPSDKERVVNEVNNLGLENTVFLNDFIQDTTSLIKNSSVLVVPSQSHESFGLTIIEAMSYGIPVVVTDVGGMPEVMGNSDAGFICSKDEPRDFSIAIKKILGNHKLALQLGRNGKKAFAERFNASKMSQQYESLIKK